MFRRRVFLKTTAGAGALAGSAGLAMPALAKGGKIKPGYVSPQTGPLAFTENADLRFQQTSWPGARIPHAWLFSDAGGKASTLDLCGHGRTSPATGRGSARFPIAARFWCVLTTMSHGARQMAPPIRPRNCAAC